MKPNYTEIILIVDRSGSMLSIQKDMEGAIQSLIDDQKKLPGECKVTLGFFNTRLEVAYSAVDVKLIDKRIELNPLGGTALYDALVEMIDKTGERLARTDERDRPSQVMVVVVTDGEENSSTKHAGKAGQYRVFELIRQQREVYSWEFVYLGANQDAMRVGTDLGIRASNSIGYSATQVGTRSVAHTLSAGMRSYRTSGKAQADDVLNVAQYGGVIPENLVDALKKTNSKP